MCAARTPGRTGRLTARAPSALGAALAYLRTTRQRMGITASIVPGIQATVLHASCLACVHIPGAARPSCLVPCLLLPCFAYLAALCYTCLACQLSLLQVGTDA